MQRATELSLSQTRTVNIIAISLIDDNAIGHFHNTALDTLQFITSTGKLNQ